ncbi:MAG: hypothetical protein AAF405_00360, partial [Pseudomonadota bacterium]
MRQAWVPHPALTPLAALCYTLFDQLSFFFSFTYPVQNLTHERDCYYAFCALSYGLSAYWR